MAKIGNRTERTEGQIELLNKIGFQKGNIPKVHYEKGHIPHNWSGGKYNYWMRKAMKTFEKHYGISWEQMHKPENHAIHHINGNRKDNNFNNLCVMTRSDHTKLHWEQGDIRGEKSGL